MWTALITLSPPENKILRDHPGYHYSISGDEAMQRLKTSGHECCYLTRFSENHNSYILSVYKKHRPSDVEKHFQITIDANERVGIEGHQMFRSIEEFLDHYEKDPIHPSLKNIGHKYTEEEYLAKQKMEEDKFNGVTEELAVTSTVEVPKQPSNKPSNEPSNEPLVINNPPQNCDGADSNATPAGANSLSPQTQTHENKRKWCTII